MSKFVFDEHGNLVKGRIPKQAVKDCTRPGPADSAVFQWVDKLQFSVPVDLARKYLVEFGAWTEEELSAKSQLELSEIVFWIACGEIRDEGDWSGLIH